MIIYVAVFTVMVTVLLTILLTALLIILIIVLTIAEIINHDNNNIKYSYQSVQWLSVQKQLLVV